MQALDPTGSQESGLGQGWDTGARMAGGGNAGEKAPSAEKETGMGCRMATPILAAPRENPLPCLFQSIPAAHISWLVAPPPS